MGRYWRIFKEFFRTCLVEELEYRSEFIGNLFSSIFGIIVSILMIQIFFYQTDQLGGWVYADVLILLGIYNTLQGLIDFALRPNMPRLLLHIRLGTLDYVLTKPVDSMFFVSLRHLVFWRLIDVVLGIGLMIYGLFQKHFIPSLLDVGFFVISIFAVSTFLYTSRLVFLYKAIG